MRSAGIFSAVLINIAASGPLSAEEVATDARSWRDRPYLTGDGSGQRARLKEAGFAVRSRLSQFVQGKPSGDGEKSFQHGGKLDFMIRTDLSRLGSWNGLSHTAKAEYNFGESVNGFGGSVVPLNTALLFPGLNGEDAFDISSFYFTQSFGSSASLLFGKINMIDLAASKRFAGGAGIDSFWNITFAAPPSGLVPAYLFGGILSYQTQTANFGLWIYDPVDCVNRSCLASAFSEGVTIRGSVEVPVEIAGLKGHHGFVALYSNFEGTDLDSLGRGLLISPSSDPTDDRLLLPDIDPSRLPTLNDRFYFAYTFDQRLYRSPTNPDEGFGLFGQFGISDGNPTRLFFSGHLGIGGTGLIPGRSTDTWGVAYFYDGFSDALIEALAIVPTAKLRDEQGFEAFYDFKVSPWFTLGLDLQVLEPATAEPTAVFVGFRNVIEF